MPSIKDLKKRIGSVKNTQQTTRAMKMVSAAKLRRAQDAIQNHRPYAQKIDELIKRVTALQTSEFSHPLLRQSGEVVEEGGGRRVLLVLLTSDRGLCGGFNSNVIKTAQRWISANKNKYGVIELGFVGRKGYEFFKARYGQLGPNFGEVGGKVAFARAKKISDSLVETFASGQVDEIKIIYNEFKNAVSQTVMVEDFLPLSPKGAPQEGQSQEAAEPMYLVKPSPKEVLEELIEKNFSIQAFRMLLESQASEHGARMSAMENATKNAGEMIRKLTLQYNKQRQAGITKELLEIISGSESQKQG